MAATPQPIQLLSHLAKLVCSAPGTDKKARLRTSFDLLVRILNAVTKLLEYAPSDWSVRRLAVMSLRALPIDDYFSEFRDELVSRIKNETTVPAGSLRGQPLDFLDLDCRQAGHLLSNLHIHVPQEPLDEEQLIKQLTEMGIDISTLNEMMQAASQRNTTQAPAPPPRKRTPLQSGSFVWKKKPYPFSRQQYILLSVLWQASENDSLAADEDVIRALGKRDSKRARNSLWVLQHATQDRLDEHRLPFEIVRPVKRHLQLKKRRALSKS